MKKLIVILALILGFYSSHANFIRIYNNTTCPFLVAYNYVGGSMGGTTITVAPGTVWTSFASPTGTNYNSAKVFWTGNLSQCVLMGILYPVNNDSNSSGVFPTCPSVVGYRCSWDQPIISSNIILTIY